MFRCFSEESKFKITLRLLLVVSILCLCGAALAEFRVGEFEFTVGGSSSRLSASLTYEEDASLEVTYDPYFGYYEY